MTSPSPVGHFLNVDLEVRSTEDLSVLAAEIGTRACVLHFDREPGGHRLTVEREDDSSGEGLEATLGDLCALVESLSPESRGLWNRAEMRTLDAGFDAAAGHPLAWLSVPPELLQRMASIRARLAITVYPRDELWPPGFGNASGSSAPREHGA